MAANLNATHCSNEQLLHFTEKYTSTQTWRVNGLMFLNAIFTGVMITVDAYLPRCRHHPLIRFLLLGTTTLFLPIVSEVAATAGSFQKLTTIEFGGQFIIARCEPSIHMALVLLWTGLVLIIRISTSVVVASDAREGRSIEPPNELLIKAAWLVYLTLSTLQRGIILFKASIMLRFVLVGLLVILVKFFVKHYAFYVTRESYSLGRNPRLIAGYMYQPYKSQTSMEQEDELAAPAPAPPALIVMGEDNDSICIKENPHGYSFQQIPGQNHNPSILSNKLVTLDRVWQLDGILSRSSEPKDLCFSFALFKLLRCRFAKYTFVEAGFMKTHKFFHYTYLKGEDYERTFRVIADELSFLHDYYFSTLPTMYSILSSIFSIGYCSYMSVFILQILAGPDEGRNVTTVCKLWCHKQTTPRTGEGTEVYFGLGNIYLDAIPVVLVLVLLMLAEIRDIVFYVCSSWTKVALICIHVRCSRWGRCIDLVFKRCRCKILINRWQNKIGQCSIQLQHPRRVSFLRSPSKKRIQVPCAVKVAIFQALKGQLEDTDLEHIRPPSYPISGPNAATSSNAISACRGRGVADTILSWHIATSIFEVKHLQTTLDSNKIVATNLSRYCTYLVSCYPELLPDDDKWCKKLYKDVKKEALFLCRALSSAQYSVLIQVLSGRQNHDVLNNGARLAKELVDSETGWEALARFWSEMILYIAPSENLEAHAAAIARGGELITLIWALLAHAGIVKRLHVAVDTSAPGDQA